MKDLYRQNQKITKPKENHPGDMIVVLGSGITGLCAGAILSKLGYRVNVLEAHPEQLGGHARTLEIEGLKFSAGPQFVWNFSFSPYVVGERVLRFL